ACSWHFVQASASPFPIQKSAYSATLLRNTCVCPVTRKARRINLLSVHSPFFQRNFESGWNSLFSTCMPLHMEHCKAFYSNFRPFEVDVKFEIHPPIQ